jgi:hypothetical protein
MLCQNMKKGRKYKFYLLWIHYRYIPLFRFRHFSRFSQRFFFLYYQFSTQKIKCGRNVKLGYLCLSCYWIKKLNQKIYILIHFEHLFYLLFICFVFVFLWEFALFDVQFILVLFFYIVSLTRLQVSV